jgi:hypothetical protein
MSFPSPFRSWGTMPLTLLELLGFRLMGLVKNKRDWKRKFADATIQDKWRLQLSRLLLQNSESSNIHTADLNELVFKALEQEAHEGGVISSAAVPGVFQSQELVPEALRAALIAQVDDLRQTIKVDWHPDSNEQILDLVHPSLYPYLINCSPRISGFARRSSSKLAANPVLNSPSWRHRGGFTFPERPLDPAEYEEDDLARMRSTQFQWLPAEFKVDAEGRVRIESYINNLHPIRHAALYVTIGQVFERILPLFEQVLGNLGQCGELSSPIPYFSFTTPRYWDWWQKSRDIFFAEHAKKTRQGEEATLQEGPATDSTDAVDDGAEDGDADGDSSANRDEDKDGDDDEEEAEELWYETRHAAQPEIHHAETLKQMHQKRLCSIRLRSCNLQVIVKLADIVLTPDKPDYPGGHWHVEGMQNEAIVATAVVYYCSENVTDDHLAFRVSVHEPQYKQNDDQGVLEIFGLRNDEPLVQDLGQVRTREGTVISFPNVYQHRVAPFGLVDRNKPGRRCMLVFFLVEPTSRIYSTAEVPPQQEEWLKEDLLSALLAKAFPQVLGCIIWDFVGPHISMNWERAGAVRARLMRERKFALDAFKEEVLRPFSLCEH